MLSKGPQQWNDPADARTGRDGLHPKPLRGHGDKKSPQHGRRKAAPFYFYPAAFRRLRSRTLARFSARGGSTMSRQDAAAARRAFC